jgi:glucose/arabinose dehydrogenase
MAASPLTKVRARDARKIGVSPSARDTDCERILVASPNVPIDAQAALIAKELECGESSAGATRRAMAGERRGPSLRKRAWIARAAACVLFMGSAAIAFATDPPTGFQETVVFNGLTNPTVVRFLPDGRVLVAEKSGLVKVFANLTALTPTVVADLRTNVHNFWDRGLLGLAIDPNFSSNGYIYALYTFDAPIGGTAPVWGVPGATSDGCPSPPGATTDGCVVSARLSRLQLTGNVAGPEQVLINDWCQQFPSHSIGSLNFGSDGYLYVSGGDGANFSYVDYGQAGGSAGSPTPKNPCGDPPAGVGGSEAPPTAEGGALRSQSLQRVTGDPVLLNGAILRVDPATGAGAPGNPLSGSASPNAQRIVGYGLRNPFRFTL